MRDQNFLIKNILRKVAIVVGVMLLILAINITKVDATEGDKITSGTTGSCKYTITELADGTYSITISGSGAMANYTYSNGMPWYSYRTKITEIIIEDGVTSIGNWAFYNFYNVTEIDLSSCTTLTTIGSYAFDSCYNATALDLSNCTSLTTIGNYAFYNMYNITEIDLSSCTSLITIGSYSFYGMYKVTDLDLNNCTALTTIGTDAFYNMYNITELDLSGCTSLTTVSGFGNWTSLNSFILPQSVVTIGERAFYNCYNITELNLGSYPNLTTIGDDAFYNMYNMTELDLSDCTFLTTISGFRNWTNLSSLVLPQSVVTIDYYAFYNCYSLTKLDLSSYTNLTTIGGYAFAYCTGFSEVIFPSSLVSIDYDAFYNCTRLTTLDFSNCTSLSYIGNYAFYNCYNLIQVDLSGTPITYIGSYSFSGCIELRYINLNGCTSLEYIYRYAFEGSKLEEIDLSRLTSLIGIEEYAFFGCFSLENVNFEGDTALTYIDYSAFEYCENLTEIDLSSCTSLEAIYDYTFAYCEKLEKVVLPTNLQYIGTYAFAYDSKLVDINLESITSLYGIDNEAFYSCFGLTDIVLPENLNYLGSYAFVYTSVSNLDLSKCTSLETIGSYVYFSYLSDSNQEVSLSLPKDTILSLYNGAIYYNLTDSQKYTSSAGYYYVDSDGVLWEIGEDAVYLAMVPSGIEEYTVPSTVTVEDTEYEVIGIDNFALRYSTLKSIIFEDPSNIIVADTYAFAYCETLEEINGYSTLTEVDDSFSAISLDEQSVEATKINTKYNLSVQIDLEDYSYNLESLLKYELDIDELSEVTLQLYCNGELAEEKVIAIADIVDAEITCVFTDLDIENEYYVDIAHTNSRWGACILYSYSGNNIATHAWINLGTKYAYTVSLDLDEENSQGDVPSIELELLDEDGNTVQTGVLEEDNNWVYVFYVDYPNNIDEVNEYISENYSVRIVDDENYEYTYLISYEDNYYEINIPSFENNSPSDVSDEGSLGISTNYCYSIEGYYEYSYNPGAIISLSYKEVVNIEGEITWEDYDNVANIRPESIVITLYNEDTEEIVETQIVTPDEDGNWNYSFVGLDKYNENDEEINYVIKQNSLEDYTTEYDGYNITNIEIEKIDIEGTIEWVDYENAGDIRPESITITLYNEETGEEIASQDVTADEEGNWTYSFTDLDKFDEDNEEITYSIVETEIENYAIEYDGYDIINTSTEIAEVAGTVTWEDYENAYETRPEKITIRLYADDEEVDSLEVKINSDNEYIYEFKNLPKYDENNEEIIYTISEDEIDGYNTEYEGFDIRNIAIKTSGVVVNYIDEETGEKIEYIAEDNIEVGTIYVSTSKNFKGYLLVEKPENEIIVVTEDVAELNYYYEYEDEGLLEKHVDISTNEILDNAWYDLEADEEYEINSKEFDGYSIATNKEYYEFYVQENPEYLDENEVTSVEELLEKLELNADDEYIPENYKGVMGDELVEVTYYYIRNVTVIARYVDVITGEEIPEVDEDKGEIRESIAYIEGHVGDTYETTEKYFENYVIVEDKYPENAEGIMNITRDENGNVVSEIEVVYYYVKQSGGVVERHIDINSGDLLEEETIYIGVEGDEYSTESKTFEGYDLVEEKLPENAEGQMTVEVIYVEYYYVKQSDVVVEYIDVNSGETLKEVDTETGEEVDSTEYIEGHEGDSYTTEKKTFKDYVLVSTTDNTEGNMSNTTTYVKYYYAHESSGVEVQHIDYITGELLEKVTTYEGVAGDEYTTTSKTFDGYDVVEDKLPSNASGTMTNDLITVQYYYIRKVTVRVQHLEIGTGKVLAAEEVIEGHEGDYYSTESKSINGYTLVYDQLPENSKGTMAKTDIMVTYYYDANPVAGSTASGGTGTTGTTTVVGSTSSGSGTVTGKTDTSSSSTPSTGDVLPIIAIAVIAVVVVINVMQSTISKKKAKKEEAVGQQEENNSNEK